MSKLVTLGDWLWAGLVDNLDDNSLRESVLKTLLSLISASSNGVCRIIKRAYSYCDSH
jgi:hypothetical protein